MSFSTAPAARIVVGALWAVIGYVYTGDVVSGAVVWGGAMVAAGWGLVAAAVATKVSSAQDAAASKQCTERQLDPGECLVMTVDIGRLGEAVRQRRAELGISQVELWKAGGPSNSTLTNIESDRDVPVHPKTLRKLDFALGWPTGRTYLALHGDGDSAERPCVSVSWDDRNLDDGQRRYGWASL